MYDKYDENGNINGFWLAEQREAAIEDGMNNFMNSAFDWAKSVCETEGDKILAAAIILAASRMY